MMRISNLDLIVNKGGNFMKTTESSLQKCEAFSKENKFKPGDKVYHRNLQQYGTFIGYAWESEDECDVEFVEEDDYVEQKHVSVNQLELVQ